MKTKKSAKMGKRKIEPDVQEQGWNFLNLLVVYERGRESQDNEKLPIFKNIIFMDLYQKGCHRTFLKSKSCPCYNFILFFQKPDITQNNRPITI